MNSKILVPAIIILVSLLGCLSEPDVETARRVDIYFQGENLGESITRGDNVLVVEEFKFIVRKFQLVTIDSVVLESADNLNSLVFSYRDTFMGDRLVISLPLGLVDLDIFKGYTLFINRVRNTDNILDSDFFGDTENYSFVVHGVYNGQNFTIKVSDEFVRPFVLDPPVTLSDDKETLLIRTLLDVENVFIDASDNSIIDPLDEGNYSAIFTLFRNNIRIEASAITMEF